MGWKRQYVIPLTGVPTTVSTVGRIRYDATANTVYRCNGGNSWTAYKLDAIYPRTITGGILTSGHLTGEIHITNYSGSGGAIHAGGASKTIWVERTMSGATTFGGAADTYRDRFYDGSGAATLSDTSASLYSADFIAEIENGYVQYDGLTNGTYELYSADFIAAIDSGSALFDAITNGVYELYSADFEITIEGGSALSSGIAATEYEEAP